MATVQVRTGTTFETRIQAGAHLLVADEPESAGGTDRGPTPYDFLAAALASCTSMTLRFFANREKIDLTGVQVTVTHDRMYAKDCAECLSKEGYIHQFNVSLTLDGNLTEAQRQELFGIAKRCPVYKTLTHEIHIVETLEA
jgi:putative redox protein